MTESVGEDGLHILGYLAVSTVFRLAMMLRTSWHRGTPRVVGRVSHITMYPIKSCKGLEVETALCTSAGLRLTDTGTMDVRDRHWIITTSEYKGLDLRGTPRLALISPTITEGCIQLTAPSMEPITVPILLPDHQPNISVRLFGDDVPAVDCGQEVADWLERHLSSPGVRLVHAAPHQERVVRSKYAKALGKTHGVAFSNVTAVMMMSEASLADLNTRLDQTLPVATFRPNIAVTDCSAYEEENWTSEVTIGEAVFSYVILCARCPATTVDLKHGVKRINGEPLRTLRSYRPLMSKYNYQPVLGVRYKVKRSGIIRVGDLVYAST